MEQFIQILWGILGTVVTTLITWGTSRLITLLNAKIKDKQVAKWSTQITNIVMSAVQSVFQSFVESLKANGKFDSKAQKEAKQAALDIITKQLTPELKQFIKDNYGDMTEWLGQQIESAIYQLKNIVTKSTTK